MCESLGVQEQSEDNGIAIILIEDNDAMNTTISDEWVLNKSRVIVIMPLIPDSWKTNEVLNIESIKDLYLNLSEDEEPP